jgi:hypothetical protein
VEVLRGGIDPFFLTLHSFSLLRYNSARTQFAADPSYIKCLITFCELARSLGYEICTALEAANDADASTSLPWTPLPTTGALASATGILKSVRGKLSALHH